MVWLKFIICVVLILLAGRRIARDADVIALKTGLGGTFVGVILVSAVTSLPELFTGISSVTIVKVPDLTVGNLFGSNAFKLLNLAILDIFSKDGIRLHTLSRGHNYTAIFGAIMVGVVGLSILTSAGTSNIGWIGWYTPVLLILYVLFARVLFGYERRQTGLQRAEHKFAAEYKTISYKKTLIKFAVSAIVLIGTSIWLAMIGEEIAQTTGLGESFIGSLFLAFSTTLPEITVSYTALRIGASDLAVANMIGSNMINMAIIAVDDLLFFQGPLLAAVRWTNLITVLAVIIMTGIIIGGLRFHVKRCFRLSWFNTSLILVFIIKAGLSCYFTNGV